MPSSPAGHVPSISVCPKVWRPEPSRTASARLVYESLRIIVLLGSEPGDDRTMGQVLAPPLGKQGRLAETGGRLQDNHRAIVELRIIRTQPLPNQEIARDARRRDLQQ